MTGVDDTHDPGLTSWVEGADDHPDFPIQNLPLGIFAPPRGGPRAGVAIGHMILDLADAARWLPDAAARVLGGTTLNALFALPKGDRAALRRRLSELLADEANRVALEPLLHRADACAMHLPCASGDYTDFYVGIHHAENVGRLFRPDQPLLPNYKWVPIGYHGRASSARPSGAPVRRPAGQRKGPDADAPTFGPSERLDYELELGVWIGPGNRLGEPIAIGDAGDHMAGFCLLNDWSARDMQAWEYQPLGPFLGKSFQTSVSPWVVTAEALAPFRVAQPPRPEGDPRPLPYLSDERDQAHGALGIELEAHLSSAAMRAAGHAPVRLSRGPATNMYWTIAQMVTHHASNGCDLRPGDLLGTGTISGPDRDGRAACSRSRKAAGSRSPCPPANAAPSWPTATSSRSGPRRTPRAVARSASAHAPPASNRAPPDCHQDDGQTGPKPAPTLRPSPGARPAAVIRNEPPCPSPSPLRPTPRPRPSRSRSSLTASTR